MRLSLFCFLPLALMANPSGEKVVSGDVAFSRTPHCLEAVQSGDKAIVEWDQFSVGHGETVRFMQPHSEASILNRVVGSELSEIYGRIEANGKVLLLNPYGIFFGEKGVVDVGSFLAAALNLENQAFLRDEDLIFSRDRFKATVENGGKILARDGHCILLAPKVVDRGSISAPKGETWLIEAEGVWIRSLKDPYLSTQVEENPYYLAVHCEEEKGANRVVRQGNRIFLVSEESRFWFSVSDSTPGASSASLESLQQLRDEIPERLWYQEFSLNLNRKKFRPSLVKLMKKNQMAMQLPPEVAFGEPTCYFLQATISGEPIRILDSYERFINTPFWQTPIYLKWFNQMRREVWEGKK